LLPSAMLINLTIGETGLAAQARRGEESGDGRA
jgi:hypothetical protein